MGNLSRRGVRRVDVDARRPRRVGPRWNFSPRSPHRTRETCGAGCTTTCLPVNSGWRLFVNSRRVRSRRDARSSASPPRFAKLPCAPPRRNPSSTIDDADKHVGRLGYARRARRHRFCAIVAETTTHDEDSVELALLVAATGASRGRDCLARRAETAARASARAPSSHTSNPSRDSSLARHS